MSLIGVRKIPLTAVGSGSQSLLQQVIALGPVALYDISQLDTLYADRSATPSTPASVDGVVGTILDLSGNDNHAIASSDAARGILRTDGTYYWIEPDGLSTNYTIPTLSGITTKNISVINAFETIDLNNQTLGLSSFFPNRVYGPILDTNNFDYRIGNSPFSQILVPSPPNAKYNSIVIDDDFSVSGYLNGALVSASPQINSSETTASIGIMGLNSSWRQTAYWFGGGLFDFALNTSQISTSFAWMDSINA